jgi:hypothetical protein
MRSSITLESAERARLPAPPVPEGRRRSDPASPSSSYRDPWAVATVLLLIAVFVTAAAKRPVVGDAWWHVRSGDLILDRGTLPREDPFAWTAAGRPWRINSWLYDVLAAAGRELGGMGVLAGYALICAFAFGLGCYLLARRAGARTWPAVASTFLVMFVFPAYIAERPQMLSFLLFMLVVVLAGRALSGSNRALIALAGTIVVWSNLHLAFAVGIGTIGLLCIAKAVQRRDLRRSATVAALSIASGLVNPLGLGAYTASFATRTTSRTAARTIEEWKHVSFTNPRDLFILVLVGVTAVFLFRSGRWRRLEIVLPITALTILTLDAIRNGPFLLALLAPELGLGLSKLRRPRGRSVGWRSRALVHGLVAGLAILVVSQLPSLVGARSAGPDTYPADAAAAIPKGCRLLNEYEFGGYITDKRWPDVLVSQDGRNGNEQDFTSQELVLEAQAGAITWLDEHEVDCVVAYPDRPLVGQLRDRGWSVRARDPSGVLLVRPGFTREP